MNKLYEAIQAYNQCLKILTKDENSKTIINIHGNITFVELNRIMININQLRLMDNIRGF